MSQRRRDVRPQRSRRTTPLWWRIYQPLSPCRDCLRFARAGERLVLFPYAAIPPGHPYSETGPIFVHAEPCEWYHANDEYPAEFRTGRVLRGYDLNYNMLDAEIVDGSEPEAIIENLLQKPETTFVDACSLTRFRIRRI